MRDLSVIFGSIVMCGFIGAAVAAFMGKSNGDGTTPTLLAAGAGLGLGFLLTAMRPRDRDGT